MAFVGVLSLAFALFLQIGILQVKVGVGDMDLSTFPKHIGLALAIGLIAGIGERALSVQLVTRAQSVLSSSGR
jgi:hypothetical protein